MIIKFNQIEKRTKTIKQYESLLKFYKQGYFVVQKINEQEINKLKEIIVIKSSEIEILIQTNLKKYCAQLNQDEQISDLKTQNLKKKFQDIIILISKYQEEIHQLKQEHLIEEIYQMNNIDCLQKKFKIITQNYQSKVERRSRKCLENLMNYYFKGKYQRINNQLSQIQSQKLELLEKTSIIDQK